MNHTQQRKRRPAAAMPGHAIALSILNRVTDRADAHRMTVFTRLREGGPVKPQARMMLLSGLAGGRA